MNIKGIVIYDAEITEVDHSSVMFSNNKATVNMICISFSANKYSDKVSGYLSIDRKQAKSLIRQLQSQLKIRTSKNHLAWHNRKNNSV